MFGKPPPKNQPPTPASRRAAHEVAKIQGGGLVQVIVTSLSPVDFYLFLNDKYVPSMDVESLSLNIFAPESGRHGDTIVRATLSHSISTVTGERTQQRIELFPCTLEIVALGRRISVTCMNPDSVEGLWIDLGLKPDGQSSPVEGARELRILIQENIVDAKLTWTDGETEDLLPQ